MQTTNKLSAFDVVATDTIRAEESGRELGAAVLDIERDYTVTIWAVHEGDFAGDRVMSFDGPCGATADVIGGVAGGNTYFRDVQVGRHCPHPAEAFRLAALYRVRRNQQARLAGNDPHGSETVLMEAA